MFRVTNAITRAAAIAGTLAAISGTYGQDHDHAQMMRDRQAAILAKRNTAVPTQSTPFLSAHTQTVGLADPYASPNPLQVMGMPEESYAESSTIGNDQDHDHLSMTSAPGPRYMMIMYFHTELTDYVLFKEFLILAGNEGGMVAACFAIFLLAVFTEFVKAFRQCYMHYGFSLFSLHCACCSTSRVARAPANASVLVPTSSSSRPPEQAMPVIVTNGTGLDTANGTGTKDGSKSLEKKDMYLRPESGTTSSPLVNLLASDPYAHGNSGCCKCWRALEMRWPNAVRNTIDTLLYTLHIILSYALMLVAMTYSVWLVMAVVFGGTCGHFLFNCWPLGWLGQPLTHSCRLCASTATLEIAGSHDHAGLDSRVRLARKQLAAGETTSGDCCNT